MGQKSTIRLVCLILFMVFAGVSCWATTESLHLLLPSWPIVFCWAVTIGLFVLSSIGSKLLVDSFNMNIYLEYRRLRLLGGLRDALDRRICCVIDDVWLIIFLFCFFNSSI